MALGKAGEGSLFKATAKLREEIAAAWADDPYPGPWRQEHVEVHTHDPPFCWGRSTHDCTKRVIEMLDSGMTLRDVATAGGMTFNAITQRLRAKGIRYVRSRGVNPAQRVVMQRMRDMGMTLADISAMLREVTGHNVSQNVVAYHTRNPGLSRCQITLTVATETVDRLNQLAAALNLSPSRALDALLLQQALEGEVDDDGAGGESGSGIGG